MFDQYLLDQVIRCKDYDIHVSYCAVLCSKSCLQWLLSGRTIQQLEETFNGASELNQADDMKAQQCQAAALAGVNDSLWLYRYRGYTQVTPYIHQ